MICGLIGACTGTYESVHSIINAFQNGTTTQWHELDKNRKISSFNSACYFGRRRDSEYNSRLDMADCDVIDIATSMNELRKR